MKVNLSNHTPDPEKFIAYIARVSNPTNQNNPDYAKLIKYLIKNGHWSPFEHSYFTFEIQTSRAIAAQILRHRSFTFQEFSQRYSEATAIEEIELRKQAVKNRQSSDEIFEPMLPLYDGEMAASQFIVDNIEDTLSLYHRLIGLGVAKEVARFILPLATQTTLYMTGSVRSWMHYLYLRNDEHTQKEHRLIAEQIEQVLRTHLPATFTALDSIKADKERDENLLQRIRGYGITDEDFLKLMLAQSMLSKS